MKQVNFHAQSPLLSQTTGALKTPLARKHVKINDPLTQDMLQSFYLAINANFHYLLEHSVNQFCRHLSGEGYATCALADQGRNQEQFLYLSTFRDNIH